jgi:hypothetical protein
MAAKFMSVQSAPVSVNLAGTKKTEEIKKPEEVKKHSEATKRTPNSEESTNVFKDPYNSLSRLE